MKNNICPFCSDDVISTAFATENGFYAIYNHAPIVPGHSLIIPSDHIIDIMLMDDTSYISLFTFARKVMQFLNSYYKTAEFDISLQQGIHAGQSVEHLHIHLIPRKPNDIDSDQEWYEKISEANYSSLDSDRVLKKSELLKISDELRSHWNSWISNKK